MSAEPIVRVRHLSHQFGATQALRDVSFDVGRGEIFGLFGPHGAGKTTALRALSTMLEPTSGHIEVAGIDAGLEPERVRHRVGYLADKAGTYPELTVGEYLAFFAVAYRLDLRSSVERTLERTKLAHARDEPTSKLSKEMLRRMHLARILLHDPDLLFLDEPTDELSPASRVDMRALLAELHAAGKTLVLASHTLSDLTGLCTSVGELKKGQLVSSGSIEPAASLGGAALAAPAPSSAGPAMTWRLRVLGSAEHAANLIRQLSGVARVVASANQLTIDILDGERSVAEVVRKLVESGIGVTGVRPELDDLERAYFEPAAGQRP